MYPNRIGRVSRPARTLAMLASASAVVVAAACSSSPPAGSGGGSSAMSTIRLVYDWPGVDFEAVPIAVGQREGFYRKQHINLQFVLPPDNATTVKMLAVGRGDIGFDTTTDVVFAHASQIPVVSIANYSQDNNWGLFTKPGTAPSLSGISGKSIGVFTDSWTKAMMPYVLKAGHVSASQVSQVIFQSNDLAPMLAGKIDIATNTSNYAAAQIQSATGKKPGVLLATKFGAPNVPIWVYTAMSSWLSQHQTQAHEFLTATREAMAWSIAHPSAAVADFMKQYPKNGSSEKYNLYGWQDTIPFLKGAGGLMTQRPSEWTEVVQALKAVHLLSSGSSPSSYYTNKYLK